MAALRDAVHGNTLEDPGLDGEEWSSLLRLADEQEILPLIVDCVFSSPSFRNLPDEDRRIYRERSLQIAVRQAVQTNEFLTLMLHAQAQGLDPIVLKGIVVRSLYPKPILRLSVDEDLLIPPEASADFHRFFLSEGLTLYPLLPKSFRKSLRVCLKSIIPTISSFSSTLPCGTRRNRLTF